MRVREVTEVVKRNRERMKVGFIFSESVEFIFFLKFKKNFPFLSL